VVRRLKEEFKKDIKAHKELEEFSIEELVLWKYNRVMNGQDLLVYRSV
jgi:hypothetical protein